MVLTIKHKFTIYRRFEQDIWGYCYTDDRCEYIYSNAKKYGRAGRKARPLKLNFGDVYKLKSPYLRFFYKLWWERRKLAYRRKRRYVYCFDSPTAFRRRRKFNWRFVSIRLTRLYFLTFQDYQFRKLFRRASKMDGISKQIIYDF